MNVSFFGGKKQSTFQNRVSSIFFTIILIVTLGFRFAEPILDGDLFWQIEYGRYLFENRTLVPDHTIYSWTPASNETIYCSWIAELFFYFLHSIGGLSLIFVFRYLCILFFISSVWFFAQYTRQENQPLSFLVMTVGILTSYVGTYQKPEIFSFVCFLLIALIFFSVKANRWPRIGVRLFYLFPVVFLFWVNSHGVFIFGLILLSVIVLSEGLNYLFSPSIALQKKELFHFIVAGLLSFCTIFANPYGYKYPLQLFQTYAIEPTDQNLLQANAYFSPFKMDTLTHFGEFYAVCILLIGALFIYQGVRFKKWDFGVIIPNSFLAYLFFQFGRTTFYWPAFWCFSVLYLKHRVGPIQLDHRRIAAFMGNAMIVLYFLFISIRAVSDVQYNNSSVSYFGFGVCYSNPVDASQFLKDHQIGTKLYNSYDVGGYLIYDLYPRYRVFCDPRYFPYKSWLKEYYNFNTGQTRLAHFERKYDFDVALVDYFTSEIPILEFFQSRDWEPVFYGYSAMVFAKKNIGFKSDFKKLDITRFDGKLKNLDHAYFVFAMALNFDDFELSSHLLDIIKNEFKWFRHYDRIVKECSLLQEGMIAYKAKDYEKAQSSLRKVGQKPYAFSANLALMDVTNEKVKNLVQQGNFAFAFQLLEEILQYQPNNIHFLYNAGIIGYWAEQEAPIRSREITGAGAAALNKTHDWREYLERLLKIDPHHRVADSVRRLLRSGELPSNISLFL